MQPRQICLITGATGGIGEAIATLFDQQGFQLILQGRDQTKLLALQAKLAGQHRIAIADIADANQRAQLIGECFEQPESAPNLLINNAGVSHFKAFTDVSGEDVDRLITTNLVAAIDLTRLFLSKATKPVTVVNVGSAFGSIGYPGNTLYCASKFGLRGFTEALQRELSDSDHRICYFAPRATDTSINSPAVVEMNKVLGNSSDSPELVAQALLAFLKSNKLRAAVGWPEKLFARINGLLPEVVDNAISKQLKTILKFAKEKNNDE